MEQRLIDEFSSSVIILVSENLPVTSVHCHYFLFRSNVSPVVLTLCTKTIRRLSLENTHFITRVCNVGLSADVKTRTFGCKRE